LIYGTKNHCYYCRCVYQLPILLPIIKKNIDILVALFIEECYISFICPSFVLPKLMWLLKSPLDQNPIMIYHKFNGDFKSHINFGRKKG